MTSSQEAQAKEETAAGQQTKPDPLEVTQLADGRSLIRHPAHGLLKLSRTGNNSHTLFGCDLRHPAAIRLEIHQAATHRQHGKDIHNEEEVLLTCLLSHQQLLEAVTGMNQSPGVPVTLDFVQGDAERRPSPPQRSLRQQFKAEMKRTLADSMTLAEQLVAETKGSAKRKAEALKQSITSRLEYLDNQFDEELTKTINQAKLEIKRQAEAASARVDVASFEEKEKPKD